MKNGKISTAKMIQVLMKHAKDEVPWTASAPFGSAWKNMTAQVEHLGLGVRVLCGNDPLTTIPWREDWTIYRTKSDLRLIGEFVMDGPMASWHRTIRLAENQPWLRSNTSGLNSVLSELVDLPLGTHRVYVGSKP